MPGQNVFDGLCLFSVCREVLGKSSTVWLKRVAWEMGGVKKAHFILIAHLRKVQPEVPFLDHQSGHCLVEVSRCDLSHTEPKLVTVHSSCNISSELHFFSALA